MEANALKIYSVQVSYTLVRSMNIRLSLAGSLTT